MKIATKAGALLAGAALSIGLLGSPASALDTSWGCGGCIKASQSGGKFIPKPFIPKAGMNGGKFIPKPFIPKAGMNGGKFIPKPFIPKAGMNGGKFIPKPFIP